MPWEVHAKLFNTATYRAVNLKISEERDLQGIEDVLWFTDVQLRLKNFCMIPYVGMFRLMHTTLDSAKPVDNECAGRYFKTITQRHAILRKLNLEEAYKNYFYWQMMNGVESMVAYKLNYQERRTNLLYGFSLLKEWIYRDFTRFLPDYDSDFSTKWDIFYQTLYSPVRPKVWWFSLACTHDVSNDSNFSIRQLLAGLVDYGCQLTAISAPCFNKPYGDTLLNQILSGQASSIADLGKLAKSPALAFFDHACDC